MRLSFSLQRAVIFLSATATAAKSQQIVIKIVSPLFLFFPKCEALIVKKKKINNWIFLFAYLHFWLYIHYWKWRRHIALPHLSNYAILKSQFKCRKCWKRTNIKTCYASNYTNKNTIRHYIYIMLWTERLH